MKLKNVALLSTGLLLSAVTVASAGNTLICHVPPGDPGNAHEIRIDDSAVPAHMDHGDYMGSCDGGGGGGVVTQLAVAEARTYCETGEMVNRTDAVNLLSGGAGYTSADQGVGTAVVWQVIGSLGVPDEGQGYCGALTLGEGVDIAFLHAVADQIRDCAAVLNFSVPAGLGDVVSATLDIAGFQNNFGLFNTLTVVPCSYEGASAVDNYGDAGDCITDGDDFAGGSFVAIHDVHNRTGDNTTPAGSFSDVNFGDTSLSPSIALDYDAVTRINAARGAGVSFIVRCADDTGNSANRTPGLGANDDNVIVIHDPTAEGFAGSFATATLVTTGS